jgi:hypothetical protein
MQIDFHYYATYCAAILAGYSHEESLTVCYSAQFVDCCTRTLLSSIGGPGHAATTQLQLEMMDAKTDLLGLQDITRIWASFHFLPRDLYADVKGSAFYKAKYRLLCGPNGDLLVKTVHLAKDKSLQAVGLAMHILADTWAHRYFAGTPSLVINNTDYWFYELLSGDDGVFKERPVNFRHNPGGKDNLETGSYIGTPFQPSERSVMCLGHGRAGHLPDYSFMRYKYLPAWGNYEVILKENPNDYYRAFTQMIYAMKFLRGQSEHFEKDHYDMEAADPYEIEIWRILEKRQLDASTDWKAFGEALSGQEIPAFDESRYQEEYCNAAGTDKDDTFLGRFILAALAQKSMVTNAIFKSGNLLAGYSIEYKGGPFEGIRDFMLLLRKASEKGGDHE